MEENTRKESWFKRNWKWAVPTGGCLLIIILIIAFAGTIFYGVTSMFSESEPYKTAFELANNNEEVTSVLGSPIENDGMIKGSINLSNDDGEAFFDVPAKGPNGNAIITVDATKTNGNWTYEVLEIKLESTQEIIDLKPDKLLD
ncbi:cytochrome c oxidase assembly factor Coa1 family protein [Patiriisocius hiemis]|uniref:Cytochrome c oxidase assembly factor Coa1 family protein n=1 Tax=Patiriisocius hiemis TaxID=3075604 RepID=A0ABU2YFK3_9FLAO|nr:cytochrome c oxidase assembly factor Coa1 family protein [Constantimarinum sp. W242]MDT0556454.1 cytochrome c oxidase assembly factor Coa1 family protein [Constantimarinum sp. W242]